MLLGCHDISPHVAPFLHDVLRKHGKTCVSWLGPTPKVTIVDPSLAKEVMSNKFGHFEKLRFPALSMLLAKGVADYAGQKWAKHRRILNPAFHLEKLKVSLTGDVISRIAFGSSYLDGREIFQLQSEQAERLLTNLKKIIIPGYTFLPTRNNRRMHQINRKIESILRTLTEKRMKAMQEGESTKDDLLGLMLHSSMTATNENSQSIPGMTIEEVTMILYEVLWLYPPAITFIRKTCKDMKIGGIAYPAGVLIELPVLFIHHDLEIWGNDALEFNPERFVEGISKASKDAGAFLPFGWGPRVCIGQQFVLLEAKMAMCMSLQHFEFSLAQAYTHAPHNVTFLRPMHGAQIKLCAI
uniref:Secologanin synthase n=1 Tax=Aegilops tauschii TaxID=37682 RepID=M8BBH9_AEGTA